MYLIKSSLVTLSSPVLCCFFYLTLWKLPGEVNGQYRYYGQYWERIVTDLEIIESPYGVRVDFTYNETQYDKGRLHSVPGCPKSIDGLPWVYYGNPTRCYLSSFRGPCPPKTLLFIERGSRYGICGCECFQYMSLREGGVSQDGRFRFCNGLADQVQDRQRNVCYNLQEQGPCRNGEWLVSDRTGSSVVCVRKCPTYHDDGPMYYDHRTGQCGHKWKSQSQPQDSSRSHSSYANTDSTQCPERHDMKSRYSTSLRRCIPEWPSPAEYLFSV